MEKSQCKERESEREGERERDREKITVVRARQLDIYMGCRVMDPLKCTTIAVKSKNASAFVFIVA